MKLVLTLYSNENWEIFFEYYDAFDAQYYILCKVESYIKDNLPNELDERDIYNYYDIIYGDKEFEINGVQLVYSKFIKLVVLPGKNPLIKPKYFTYRPAVIEYPIITLDEWFDQTRQEHELPDKTHSALKNSVDVDLNKY